MCLRCAFIKQPSGQVERCGGSSYLIVLVMKDERDEKRRNFKLIPDSHSDRYLCRIPKNLPVSVLSDGELAKSIDLGLDRFKSILSGQFQGQTG